MSGFIIVCGSREWPTWALPFVGEMIETWGDGLGVMAGGAQGVDRFAIQEARRLGLPHREVRADWSVKAHTPPGRVRRHRDGGTYDVMGGLERNTRMLDMGPMLVLAFVVPGRSKGTEHMVRIARERGVGVYVWTLADVPASYAPQPEPEQLALLPPDPVQAALL